MFEDNLKYHQRILDNGLNILVLPNHRSPIVTVQLGYNVGSKDEAPSKSGFAHLFEHLMFEGSRNIARGQYDKLVAKAGGACNAYTSYDQTVYFETLPANQLELSMWMQADRMSQFNVTPIGLETQQNVIAEEMKQVIDNQPYAKWRRAQATTAWTTDQPYSWEIIGSEEDVRGATLDDVRDFFERFYRPDNATLVIAGDVDPSHGFSLGEKHFGSIKRDTTMPERRLPSETWKKGGVHQIVPDTVPHSAVFLCYHCGGSRANSLVGEEMLATIAGNGRSSALYKKLVHESQLCSQAGSFLDRRQYGSLLTFYAFASNESTTADELATSLREVLANIAPSLQAEDLEKARTKMLTDDAESYQYCEGIAGAVLNSAISTGSPQSLQHYYLEVEQISIVDLQRVSANTVNHSNEVRVDVIPISQTI